MTKRSIERKAEKFDKIMARKVKTILSKLAEKTLWNIFGDAYAILPKKFFTSKDNFEGKGNLPRMYVEDFVHVYNSKSIGTIYVNGNPVKSLEGILAARIVEDLIDKFGIEHKSTAFLHGKKAIHSIKTGALIEYLKS